MVQGRSLLLHRNWLPHLPSSSPPIANTYAQEKICFGPSHHICPITHPCASPASHLMTLTILQCPLNFILPTITHPCASAPPNGSHAYTCAVPYRYASDPATPSLPSPSLQGLCSCSAL
ncbi:hypothetical protein O181_086915 [Austropuccinia psidii MF-1]|uniref:Uncharacterized protein n=1 Tax=Austropuccinia psidii MF-1 TaxID=1389203 RepID=A0A9Q3INP3_9BASI|nr:hypothetical protein [Austropuccinia psidii MF-1]